MATPLGTLRGVVVDNHSVAPKNRAQPRDKELGKEFATNLFSVPWIRTYGKSGKVNGCVHNEMGTYGSRVDPTDLRLEFCESHKQNYVVFPLVSHSSRCRTFGCIRSARDVCLDIAQRFELVFLDLSTFHEILRKAKHVTWFFVVPLGVGQIPCVFGDSRRGTLCWRALG